MEGTQKGMDGGMPREVCVERGSGPAAVPLPGAVCPPPPVLCGSRGHSTMQPPLIPGMCCPAPWSGLDPVQPGPGDGVGGDAAGPPLAWGSSGQGRRQQRFTMREDRA